MAYTITITSYDETSAVVHLTNTADPSTPVTNYEVYVKDGTTWNDDPFAASAKTDTNGDATIAGLIPGKTYGVWHQGAAGGTAGATFTTTSKDLKIPTTAQWQDLATRINNLKTNAGAPTTSTVGAVGQLLADTTNGKLYICTAVTPGTDPDPDTYTWEEIAVGNLGDYVTRTTDQNNITGEKTFVGNKRIKFKGSSSTTKLGFTCYDNTNKEVAFLEATGTGAGEKTNFLGIYDNTATTDHNNYLGFQYFNNKPVSSGGAVQYNLVVPPDYRGVSGVTQYAYIPIEFTDGTSTVKAGVSGVVDISSLIPAGGSTITMTSSDPGEGSPLAANSFIAVYDAS